MSRRMKRRSWFKLIAGMGLVFALPGLTLVQIRSASHEIDLILDQGMGLLDRTESLLQNLLDIRAGVLTTLIEMSEADRRAVAFELAERLERLDQQNDALAALEVQDLVHPDERHALKGFVDLAEASVRQIIDQCLAPDGDIVVSPRSAMAVSAEIDACASEVHVLSTRVAARASIADAAIPEALSLAQLFTLALAAVAAWLGFMMLARLVSPPRAAGAGFVAKPAGSAVAPPPLAGAMEDAPPLRILHVLTHHDARRGGAIQALLLAQGQQQRGQDVRVAVNARRRGAPLDDTFDTWVRAGVRIDGFVMDHPKGVWCPPGEVLRLRRFIRAGDFDVIHVHRDKALLFTLLATIGLRGPAIVSQRGTTHVFRHRSVAFAHRWRRVDRIVAVAGAVKQALVAQGVDRERVEVVYGSFDVDRFDPGRVDGARVRDELGLAAGQRLVVVVGELSQRKDPATFIRAFGEVAQRRQDVLFVHVGNAEARQQERYHAMGRELCGERLRFLGWRADVPQILAAADVLVCASAANEGLTGAVREGLALARPVVCTATDGNPEVVLPGRTGLLVPARSPSLLAYAIEALLDDREAAARMGRAGRTLVLETMANDVRTRRILDLYREVVREREAGSRGARAAAGPRAG